MESVARGSSSLSLTSLIPEERQISDLYASVLKDPSEADIRLFLSYLASIDSQDLVDGLLDYIVKTKQKPEDFSDALVALIEHHSRTHGFDGAYLTERLSIAFDTVTFSVHEHVVNLEVERRDVRRQAFYSEFKDKIIKSLLGCGTIGAVATVIYLLKEKIEK